MTDPILSITIADGHVVVTGEIEKETLAALKCEVSDRGRARNSTGSAVKMLPVKIRVYPFGVLIEGPIEARIFVAVCAPWSEKNGWTSFPRAARKIGVNTLLTDQDHVANISTSLATP